MPDDDSTAAERTVTQTLAAIGRGDRAAADELLPMVYEMLRERAGRLMDRERDDHTLTATALVHEAYLRVAGREGFDGGRHFFNAAALAMRRILVEHARGRGRIKRGGEAGKVELESLELPGADADGTDWLALDEALERLKAADERRHQVVMLRFFAGLEEAEIAKILNVTDRTVRRDWAAAQLWLYGQMNAARE